MNTNTRTPNAPSVVLKVMKKSFGNVSMRLCDERPWSKVPDGYVISDHVIPVLHEDAVEVAVVWKGTNAKRFLKSAYKVLEEADLQVRVKPRTAGSPKACTIALMVSFPNRVV